MDILSEDLMSAKSAIGKLRQDMEASNRLAKPSYLGVIEQLERTIEPFRLHQMEISRALEIPEAVAGIKEIANANQHWHDVIKQTTASNWIAESLHTTHESWLDQSNLLQQGVSQLFQLQASAKLALGDTSLQLIATERLMANIDFKAIGSQFQIKMPAISGLESSIAQVAASYGSLAGSLREVSDITRLPAFVLPGATREIYTTSFALKTLRPWGERDEEEAETEFQFVAEAELETSDCIILLQQVDPSLAGPYIGARDALNGNSADRARHILTSLRELWNHLLRRLAPDDLVTAWILSLANQKDLLHEGKPTRRARVLYVCRELYNDPLSEFVIQDTKALVKLIEFFNRVHELETKLTDEQLRAILLKSDPSLMYILQISTEVGGRTPSG